MEDVLHKLNSNTVYWNKLDKLVGDYNNTRHSSIKMKPVEASKKENEEKVFANLYGDLIYLGSMKPKLAIGDEVRISKYKRRVFDKGYTPNWTEEVFVVNKTLPTKPVTYKIVDLMGEVRWPTTAIHKYIYHITAFYILVHKHIHWLCEYIYQYLTIIPRGHVGYETIDSQ